MQKQRAEEVLRKAQERVNVLDLLDKEESKKSTSDSDSSDSDDDEPVEQSQSQHQNPLLSALSQQPAANTYSSSQQQRHMPPHELRLTEA